MPPVINKENGIKKELSFEDLGDLLAAFGNHEAKALLLVAMHPEIVYSRMDLHRLMMAKQGEFRVWNMGNTIPFDHCDRSLSPIGLVTKRLVGPFGDTIGFITTDYGKNIGTALAGHLLTLVSSGGFERVSLRKLFGSTGGGSLKQTPQTTETLEQKRRSPLTRYKIFWELLTASLPITEAALGKAIGLKNPNVLTRHLSYLAENGIITYEVADTGKPMSVYKRAATPPQGPLPVFRSLHTLTEEVYGFLETHPQQEVDSEIIYKWIVSKNTERNQNSEKWLKNTIACILNLFARKGYVQLLTFPGSERSRIFLTETQRDWLLSLMTMLDRFSSLDPIFLREGKQLADGIVNNPKKFSALLQKAKEASPYANSHDTQTTAALLFQLINEHPGITTKKLRDLLRTRYEIEMGTDNIRQILMGRKDVIVEKQARHLMHFPKR